MTVAVAFLCADGVVVAADSMLTTSLGNLSVGHHHGKKVDVLPGPQVFAFAGDQGQAARFRHLAETNHARIAQYPAALDYGLNLTASLIAQFQATGIVGSININTLLAFLHGGGCHCCVFDGLMQPRLLDAQHFYVALGSGKLGADPFLRFLDDIFCRSQQPTVRQALFLATWTIQHVIETNPGGVAGPIRIAVFEKNAAGQFLSRELPANEIDEHQQAVESAAEALRKWRDDIEAGNVQGVPPPPVPPRP